MAKELLPFRWLEWTFKAYIDEDDTVMVYYAKDSTWWGYIGSGKLIMNGRGGEVADWVWDSGYIKNMQSKGYNYSEKDTISLELENLILDSIYSIKGFRNRFFP